MPEGDTGTPTWKFTQYVTSSDKTPATVLCSVAPRNILDQASSRSTPLYSRCLSTGLSEAFALFPLVYLKARSCLLIGFIRCFGDKGDVEDITEGAK